MSIEREIFSVPYSLIGGRYLGSTSRILLAGSLSNNKTQLDILDLSSNTNTATYQSNIIRNTWNLKGTCTAIEIFGHSSIGKSFTAIASHQNGEGQLTIYEIPSQGSLGHHDNFRAISHQQHLEDSIYTCITSHSNNNQLTACTEFGDVIIHDFSGQEITRFNADYCGLKSLKYSNSGDLITLGLSSGGQLSLWDTRSPSHVPSLIRCLRPPPLTTPSSGISYLTSILTSHRNDYEMICGTSTGSIIQWDTRSNGVIFSPHQVHDINCSVTSLTPDPLDPATIISGGSDGTIASTEFDLFTTSGSRTKPSFLSSTASVSSSLPSQQPQQPQPQDSKLKILTDVYEIPAKEVQKCESYFSSSVMSLDSSDMISKQILAVGRLGEVSFINSSIG